MNATMERWVLSCRRELLDRTLIWDQRHLMRALREFEDFYNYHRPHQGIANVRPAAARRDPERVRPCRLSGTDEIIGRHTYETARLRGDCPRIGRRTGRF